MKINVRVLTNTVRVGLANYKKKLRPVTIHAMEKAMKDVLKKITGNFPGGANDGYDIPYRDGQRYVRTGRLGRSTWLEAEESGNNGSVKFFSDTEYSPFVLGDNKGEGQAWMHAGRWPNAYEEINDAVDDITELADSELDDLARQEGLTAND